jgi:hypothetical protein
MRLRTAFAPLLASFALASPALADDPAARAQLIQQQRSDAFALQLQQSVRSFQAGSLPPAQRLELETLQRDQRLQQSDSFYRQQVQQSQTLVSPPVPGAREAELMRFKQQNAEDLSRAASEAANQIESGRPLPEPRPNAEPRVIWGPVLR